MGVGNPHRIVSCAEKGPLPRPAAERTISLGEKENPRISSNYFRRNWSRIPPLLVARDKDRRRNWVRGRGRTLKAPASCFAATTNFRQSPRPQITRVFPLPGSFVICWNRLPPFICKKRNARLHNCTRFLTCSFLLVIGFGLLFSENENNYFILSFCLSESLPIQNRLRKSVAIIM